MTHRQQIEKILETMPRQMAVDLLNSLAKHWRAKNRKAILIKVNTRVDDRPDLLTLKEK